MEKRVYVYGYEGRYIVSDTGKIISKKTKESLKKRIVNGYVRVELSKNGERYSAPLHRVVYCSFNKMPIRFTGWYTNNVVMHKNDIRDDNRLCNVMMGSQKDNVDDMIKKGRGYKMTKEQIRKRTLCSSKINCQTAEDIRLDYKKTKSIYRTAAKYGVSYATVSRIINNKIWRKDLWIENNYI